ncbi:MAG: M23 family metallopeptidase [Pseudomonadota bacterium]|nr:M23 family metallopeptidase [Pseudomonadota bacterium]
MVNNKINSSNISKDQFNEELLKKVLQGAGFNLKDANLAINSFSFAYPLERLTDSSYLILPFGDKKFDSFAISINGIEAVLITKTKKTFKTFITSTEYAHYFLEKERDKILDNKNLLEIEDHFIKIVPKNSNFADENIVFNKGDTLLNFLYIPGAKRKSINEALNAFSVHFNPKKIKIKTKGKIVRTNNGNILGFYLFLSKRKAIITYLTPAGYQSAKVHNKDASILLYKNIKKYLGQTTQPNKTRISLLNDPQLKKKNIKIMKGSNLFNTLKKHKQVDINDLANMIESLRKIYNPKNIKAGQNIILAYKNNKLFALSVKVNELREVQVINTDAGFKEYIYEKPVKKISLFREIIISSNLYVDSIRARLPQEILIDMVRLFSYSIDFQRDIRKSNKFIVFYEYLQNYQGVNIMPGNIIYAKAKLDKNEMEMFKFKTSDGENKYYNQFGESIRKTLMKTPIDGARLSSGFGKRIHPILGYSKMHKGVDFAAKQGTPIYAAGDGIIERANTNGGYGKYIRIRHNSEYKTAYAHLYKFARKIKKGVFVKQGQTIGYVGSTGRSTGPHLHYEILLNNKHVNPQKLKLPDGKKLNKDEMKDFDKIKADVLEKVNFFIR